MAVIRHWHSRACSQRSRGALVSAPFAMVLLAAFTTQIGALQTASILIAVVTAFLAMEGVKYAVVRRTEQAAARAP